MATDLVGRCPEAESHLGVKIEVDMEVKKKAERIAYLKFEPKAIELDQIDLQLILSFAEASTPITGGAVRVSFVRAELNFELEGCILKYQHRKFRTQLKPYQDLARTLESTSSQARAENSTNILKTGLTRESVGIGIEVNERRSNKAGEETSQTDEFETRDFYISFHGSEQSPFLIIAKAKDKKCLSGELPVDSIGKVNLTKKAGCISASLNVQAEDINAEGVSPFYSMNIIMKDKILKRMTIKQLNISKYVSKWNIYFNIPEEGVI